MPKNSSSPGNKTSIPLTFKETVSRKAITTTTVATTIANEETTLGVIKLAVSLLAKFVETTVATALANNETTLKRRETTVHSVANDDQSTCNKPCIKKDHATVFTEKILEPTILVNSSNGNTTSPPHLFTSLGTSLFENREITEFLITITTTTAVPPMSAPMTVVINQSIMATNASVTTKVLDTLSDILKYSESVYNMSLGHL